jgi:hypothetical protein
LQLRSSFAKNIAFVTLPVIILIGVLLELTFRFFIPACETPFRYFDESTGLLKYVNEGPTEGWFSVGPLCQPRAKWRGNNLGWISGIDYHTARSNPLVAVIGDSYVEASQVGVEKSFPALLRRSLARKLDVYSFGNSGAHLGTYLSTARYCNKQFDPDVLVITVVHNDFVESLCPKTKIAGLCYALENGAVKEKLPPPFVVMP